MCPVRLPIFWALGVLVQMLSFFVYWVMRRCLWCALFWLRSCAFQLLKKKKAIKRTITVFKNHLTLGALGLASTPRFSQRLPSRRSIQTCFSALLLPHLAVVCVWVSYSHNKRFKRTSTESRPLILKSRLAA